jgi:Uma2 family endonuclease
MYPDAIVVCGLIDLAEDQVRAPTAVVEVLSPSTRITTAASNGWPAATSTRCSTIS